ncbi:MAG: bifunctional DNA-formamidopyrimidine glycosylase/DNA-(apurinic or apyrimidinic site) lyase [Gemmataceae bacterium]|nr:bifunctional DNA-formamidopyrimidine glycosylase/DNA-(apurinic or apyrimidinic site) lyase [Gemmataceae bacterium]
MPELPEVETVVRDLRSRLVGRRLAAVQRSSQALRHRWRARWNADLIGRQVRGIERRGKWILIDLDGPWLVVHLGMTGQFVVEPAAAPRHEHTHLTALLEPGDDELRFRDVRRFGSAVVYPDRRAVEDFLARQRLGPEPFALDPAYWRATLQKTERSLKAILLDQRVLAGVGNIYADEACFEARLRPCRRGSDLTPRQAEVLRRAIAAVLERAIARRGSSIRNYIGGSGLRGEYQQEFRVYGRAGQPCHRCSAVIERIVLAGRATHFCPRCQR